MKSQKIFILILSAILVGCVTFKEMQNIAKLRQFPATAEAYAKVIRWSDFEAAGFYAKPLKEKLDFERLNAYRVTAYEVKEIVHKRDELRVHQTISLKYFNRANPTEKSSRYEEIWEYDPRDQAWYLNSGFPEFD